MRRFFTEPQNIENNIAKIYEDAGHISKVLRMEIGDCIMVFDGSGYEYKARLTEIKKDVCSAEILEKAYSEQEPKVKAYLFQCLPKSGKMEEIIQKSVELGISGVIPVCGERCVTRIEGDKKIRERVSRWNKVSVSAAKQCGRGIIPEVKVPVTYKEAIEMLKNLDLAVMPYEELGHTGVSNLKSVLSDNSYNSIGILIGPEGGFSDSEALYAKEQGVYQVGLGKRILRTETAGIAVISAIMYENNEY